MSIIAAYLVPHPPIVVPEVGKGEERKINSTSTALQRVADEISKLKPDTIIISSPHSAMYMDYFHISPGRSAKGDFTRFGVHGVTIAAGYDTAFVEELTGSAERQGLPAGTLGETDTALDHGTTVPLYFINKVFNGYMLVRAGLSGMGVLEHYKLGKLIAQTAEKLGRRAVFIASGDLSHRLKTDGPYGFAPEGPVFDKELTDAASSGDFLKLMQIDPGLAEAAGECGLKSFIIMAGALDGKSVKADLYSYEGPFGVGYAVCSFQPAGDDPERHIDSIYLRQEKNKLANIINGEDSYAHLARTAAEHYVRTSTDMRVPDGLPTEMYAGKAGVFVSVKKHGELRGCIGTISPVRENIAAEIIRNAASAVSEDPRFAPVIEDELDLLTYSVDILGKPEPAEMDTLDPLKYGVIVTSGSKRGLLLPNLEGVTTADQQVDIAMRKAGINPTEKYKLERFEVVRHK